MVGIKNKQGVDFIIMKPFAECLCGIGQDWYHIDFEVYFMPAAVYPDYMDVSKFVSENISGKELNIEEAVSILGNMLQENYSPRSMNVRGIVDKVVTHFPVEVGISYE